jgi:hypothetical protein
MYTPLKMSVKFVYNHVSVIKEIEDLVEFMRVLYLRVYVE